MAMAMSGRRVLSMFCGMRGLRTLGCLQKAVTPQIGSRVSKSVRLTGVRCYSSLVYQSCVGASEKRFMEDRVALVTGSTSGIGLGIAHALAARGCSIVITGLGTDEQIKAIQEEFKTKYAAQVDYVAAELTDVSQIEAMCRQVNEMYPNGIDILVNNAGFQHVSPVQDFPTEKWDNMIAVMLSAPFHFIKHFVPGMRKKGWGRIVNIASAHGIVASPNKSAYVACKHGIVGLTKVIALESADAGITCNAICPGYVNTAILQGQVQTLADKKGLSYDDAKGEFLANFHPTKAPIGIEQIAETVMYLCSDAASQMTGTNMVLDGGWTAR